MSSQQEVIQYLREDIGKIDRKLDDGLNNLSRKIDSFVNNYATKEEVKNELLEIKEAIKDLREKKVDVSVFKPIQDGISRLNWLVISGVCGALLVLIFK